MIMGIKLKYAYDVLLKVTITIKVGSKLFFRNKDPIPIVMLTSSMVHRTWS